jgi:hypothetical protein
MSELSDNAELQKYSSAVLRVFSSAHLPSSLTHIVLENLVSAIQSSEVYSFYLNKVFIWNFSSHGEFDCMHCLPWSFSSIGTS